MANNSSESSSSQSREIAVDTSATDRNPFGFKDMTRLYSNYRCKITHGALPAWLEGTYLKQTGAAFNSSLETAQLDGLAGITSFSLAGTENEALYSSTILDQRLSRDYLASNGRVRGWIGTGSSTTEGQPSFTDRVRMFTSSLAERLGIADKNLYTGVNPNVVIWRLTDPADNSTYAAAATEADGTVLRFDKETLESVGPVKTLQPTKGMVITTPAHYYEPRNNTNGRGGPYHVALEMSQEGIFPPSFRFTYAIYSGSSAPFRRVTGRELAFFSYLERERQPLEKRPGYMHCYAQTTNYLILFASRLRLSYTRLLARDFSKGFFGLFDPSDAPLEFIVFRINTDATKEELEYAGTFSNPNYKLHVWHMSNAYEDSSGDIVMDFSSTDYIGAPSKMRRARINLVDKTVAFNDLGPNCSLEFPQSNPLCNFANYRYTYALALGDDPLNAAASLAKVDVQTGEIIAKIYNDKQHSLAEPVFVPRTRKYGALEPSEELDGVVLLAVTHISTGSSWLSVIQPSDFSEICRVEAPQTINAGLHSHFLPKQPLISKF